MRRLCGLLLAAGWLMIAHAGDRDSTLLREQGLLEYDNGHYAAAVIFSKARRRMAMRAARRSSH